MSQLKRPASVGEGAELYRVWVEVGPIGIHFKFHRGGGIGIRRDNPDYLRAIGEWFCREVDAPPTVEYCEHGTEEGDYCETCNAEYKRARAENGDAE